MNGALSPGDRVLVDGAARATVRTVALTGMIYVRMGEEDLGHSYWVAPDRLTPVLPEAAPDA